MRLRAEIALLITGLCLLSTAGLRILRRTAFDAPPESLMYPVSRLVRAGGSNLRLLAKLEIPRLGLMVPVVEGDDEAALSVASGHVPGTEALGGMGNSVIAGHRDAEFRALREIAVGDRIRVKADKTYIYVVNRIQIVKPDNLAPLQNTKEPTLTLVTCYPFRYVGDAPKRFIVQAELAGT